MWAPCSALPKPFFLSLFFYGCLLRLDINLPFGMTFTNKDTDNYFFLGNTNEVRRFPYQKGQEQIVGTGEKIADLPGRGYNQHWTRNVVISPDQQKLYVSVGSASNVSEEALPRACVQTINLDGSQQQTFAYGLRNPVSCPASKFIQSPRCNARSTGILPVLKIKFKCTTT